MKNKIVGIVSLLLIVICGFYLLSNSDTVQNNESFLRIHIRANSNTEKDQKVKYFVKEAIVNYLIPYLSYATTKEKAKEIVNENILKLTAVADNVLRQNGFSYSSNIQTNSEFFPTRKYDDFILDEGVYDAVIVNLGTGAGDNWWCVVYPPLCFVGGENNGTNQIRYKSKIKEIIESFRAKTKD